jgi:Na+/H+ antiporter NhaC
VAFVSSNILSIYKKLFLISQLPSVVAEGFNLIKSSIVMVVLASILGSFLRLELQTGNYLAYLLLGKTPLFLIPVLLFLGSSLIALMTGSAWGAFAMLIPISTQMLIGLMGLNAPVSLEQVPLLFPVLGAVLSGAACGNHLSPFAETTFMTAASTGTDPIEHAKTQFLYAIPVIIGTIVSFVLAGLMVNDGLLKAFLVPAAAGLTVTIALLLWFAYARKQA